MSRRSRAQIQAELEAAAGRPTPSVDAVFADALEQRLRAVHATTIGASAGAEQAERAGAVPTPARRPWLRSPIAVATAAVIVIAVAFGTNFTSPAETGLELASARDATVTLPNGDSVPARAGLRLQEGAVVLTGPGGHVEVGGVTLGPRQMAVVRQARLERVKDSARRPQPSPESPRPEQRPSPAPVRPGTGDVRDRPVVLPSLSPAPARPTREPRPEPTDSRIKESPRPEPSSTAAPMPPREGDRPAEGQAAPGGAYQIGLSAKGGPHGVSLLWTAYRHPDYAFTVVLRAPWGQSPQWPPAGETRVIGRGSDPERRQFDDREPGRTRPVYRIVMVDRHGRELARSRAVTPPAPDADSGSGMHSAPPSEPARTTTDVRG